MLSMGNFLGKFSYTFSKAILWSTYEQLLTWICYYVSNQKLVLTSYFNFDILFWISSAILHSKKSPLFLNLYTSPQWARHYLTYLMPRKVCTSSQIKRFPLVKFWYTILMYRGTDFRSNNIEKHPSHKYLFFLTLLE